MALALATDIRVGTAAAKMNAAFTRVGLSACELGVSYLFPRLVGASVAAEILFTGRFLEPERARALGLFSKIVPENELQNEANSLVADLLRSSPLGLKLTKEALNYGLDAPSLEVAIGMESRSQVLAMQDGNFGEGIAAFHEKREPRFV
jgi:enoyl-CoA hydratase/carnithine racemase